MSVGRTIESWRQRVAAALPDAVLDNSSRITSGFTFVANVLTAVSGFTEGSNFRAWGSVFDAALTSAGVVLKELPQTPEEIARLEAMTQREYIAERLKHAVLPHKHIRQTLGAGFIITGGCLITSGIKTGRVGEVAIGALVVAAGITLGYTLETREAWKKFGGVVTAIQVVGVGYAIESGTLHHDNWIGAAQLMHMMTAATSYLIGGEKEARLLRQQTGGAGVNM